MSSVLRHTSADTLELTAQATFALLDSDQHPSYIKWTHASVNKHFEDFNFGIPIYIEGDERTFQDESEFAELRMDGPFITRVNSGLAYWDIEVNVLLQMHQTSANLYSSQVLQGRIVAAFTNYICIYRLGNTVADDKVKIGFYRLRRDYRESIDVNHFGVIRPGTRMVQTTVEGHYRWEVSLI